LDHRERHFAADRGANVKYLRLNGAHFFRRKGAGESNRVDGPLVQIRGGINDPQVRAFRRSRSQHSDAETTQFIYDRPIGPRQPRNDCNAQAHPRGNIGAVIKRAAEMDAAGPRVDDRVFGKMTYERDVKPIL
jgi:hypothetical protein